MHLKYAHVVLKTFVSRKTINLHHSCTNCTLFCCSVKLFVCPLFPGTMLAIISAILLAAGTRAQPGIELSFDDSIVFFYTEKRKIINHINVKLLMKYMTCFCSCFTFAKRSGIIVTYLSKNICYDI